MATVYDAAGRTSNNEVIVDILSLTRMMQFGDSMLPTGAFAFSGALEAAVQKHVVHDVQTLQQYVVTSLQQASTSDAVGVAEAMRVFCDGAAGPDGKLLPESVVRLRRIDEAVYRRRLPEELRSMMVRTGRKLAELGSAVVRDPIMKAWKDEICECGTPGTYPVSLAALFAASARADRRLSPGSMDEIREEALTAYLYGVSMGILNASLRLMRVTHYDVQNILYRISYEFDVWCRIAEETPLERMTGYAPMTDILSAVHARSHVRLFMS